MTIERLIECIGQRQRPEDVAQIIVESGAFSGTAAATLDRAASQSAKRLGWRWSSMAAEFGVDSVKFERQAKAIKALFSDEHSLVTIQDAADAVAKLSPLIHREPGELRRMNKSQRRAVGIWKNARWYNKRFKLLLRIERKVAAMARHEKRNRLRVISKTSLASQLPDSQLTDLRTVCFVAYMSARMARRAVFTNQSQSRAFDDIAEAMMRALNGSPTTNWFAVAHVMPDPPVLRRLTDEQRGRLLSGYWSVLEDAGSILRQAWENLGVDRETMIVRSGSDSSTWNEGAGAWNQARSAWVSLLYSMNAEAVLDRMLPGKAMRVMAADVARWHLSSGGTVHPDTKVWASLPLPWFVLDGTAQCGRGHVADACRSVGVDPSGWIGSRPSERVAEEFRPTPELVHGVAVSSPSLAAALRKAGVFSGKVTHPDTLPDFDVVRDDLGFAVAATEGVE